jgi:hypothetical protein
MKKTKIFLLIITFLFIVLSFWGNKKGERERERGIKKWIISMSLTTLSFYEKEPVLRKKKKKCPSVRKTWCKSMEGLR